MRYRWRDLQFGLRLLWKSPGFTTVAVLAPALGIGANTAIFSVVYATLRAPLPYDHPDRIVMVWSKIGGQRNVVESVGGDRFGAVLFGTFAGIALLLAAFGIYGVMSFGVAQRTHEIALRMALARSRLAASLGHDSEGRYDAGSDRLAPRTGWWLRRWTIDGQPALRGRQDRLRRLQRGRRDVDAVRFLGVLHPSPPRHASRSIGRAP
jgi:hypothetical protein